MLIRPRLLLFGLLGCDSHLFRQLQKHRIGNNKDPEEIKKELKLKQLQQILKDGNIGLVDFLENASAIMKKKWDKLTHDELKENDGEELKENDETY